MNYNELKDTVQDYLENSEDTFVDNIPNFVKLVENRVYNDPDINFPELRKNVTGLALANERYLSLPNDFQASFSLAFIDDSGEYDYAELKDVNLIREVYPSPATKGKPKYYAVFNKTTFILGPTPDKNYPVELHYFFYPETLVTAGTTWLATTYPSVMQYGVIAEGYRFLKGDAAQQKVYDQQYEMAMNLMRGQGYRLRSEAYSTKKPKVNPLTGE